MWKLSFHEKWVGPWTKTKLVDIPVTFGVFLYGIYYSYVPYSRGINKYNWWIIYCELLWLSCFRMRNSENSNRSWHSHPSVDKSNCNGWSIGVYDLERGHISKVKLDTCTCICFYSRVQAISSTPMERSAWNYPQISSMALGYNKTEPTSSQRSRSNSSSLYCNTSWPNNVSLYIYWIYYWVLGTIASSAEDKHIFCVSICSHEPRCQLFWNFLELGLSNCCTCNPRELYVSVNYLTVNYWICLF